MEREPIVRLAAKGDGVTQSGRHVAMAVTGDFVDAGGDIVPGPHHLKPVCKHFAKCGGCQLQHADETVLNEFVKDRVVNAARGQDVDIGELLEVHLSPARARRRAKMHGLRTKSAAIIGFKESGSHKIIDLSECHVVDERLFELISPLRKFVAKHGPQRVCEIDLTLCDQGVDVALSNFPLDGLGPTEAVLEFARENGLARLCVDQGFSPETVWEPEPASVTMNGTKVDLPPSAFLQATPDAEALMIELTAKWLKDARIVADLFAGLGTFAFGLARNGPKGRKVLAVEADQSAHLACKSAAIQVGGKVLAMHRDLFRNPLTSAEISRFDAALLDPPRAGAKAQIAQIAQSDLARCVYVSCNPSSWARDAASLVEAGFKLSKLAPIGQFRWSNHVELVSLFER